LNKKYEPAPHPHDDVSNPILWAPSLALLKYAIATNLVGSVIFLIVARFVAPDQPARLVAAVLLALVAMTAWYFLSRRRMQSAVNMLAIGVWMVITGASAFNGGVRAPLIVAYPLMILMFGWLISQRAALAVAALTVAAIIGLVMSESWGFLPYAPPSPPALHGVVQVSLVVLATLIIIFLVRIYQNRLKELGQIDRDLASHSRDLEASKDELNRAQAVARVGSWAYDIATDIVRLSAETCRIFDLPEGTTESREYCLARVHAEDRSAVNWAWQGALKGDPFDREHRIMVGDAIRWVRQKAELEFAADGTVLRALGITQDITERKQAESIATSERFIRTITDAMPGMVGYWDKDLRCRFANQPYLAWFGKAPEEIIGSTMMELMGGALFALNEPYIRAALAGEKQQFERTLTKADGSIGYTLANYVPDIDAHGIVAGFHVLVTDVTPLKQAQAELQLASAVYQNTAEAIMVADAQGIILSVNPAFTQITGYTALEAIGQTPRLLRSNHHEQEFHVALWQQVMDTGQWQGEIWNRRKDGELFLEWQSITRLPGSNDESARYLSVFRDITEHSRLQAAQLAHAVDAEVSASRQRLRELVRFNDAALEEDRKHIAREVHDELGQVLTALRMDIALVGMRFGSLDPAVNDKVKDMKRLVDRAILGVRNVAVNLRPAALDMGLVSAIEWLCNEFTRQTTIACLLIAEEEDIDLGNARAVVIFRIVQESLTNITRYAEASQVDISLGRRGNELGLEVRDNGRGFDLVAAAKRKSFGLLGMRERALALGGQVDIVSAPGKGTVVAVTIPIDLEIAKETS